MKPFVFSLTFYLVFSLGIALNLFAAQPAFAISEHTEVLKDDQWPEYVNGTNMIALPQISEILKRFREDEKISIEIRYPGGDLGKQQAESLSNWFVTFGIPQNYIELLPGAGGLGQLVINLIDRR